MPGDGVCWRTVSVPPRRLLAGIAVATLVLAGSGSLLSVEPLSWLGGALAAAVLLAGHTAVTLSRTPARRATHVFGLANAITLVRGVMFCAVAGFVVATPTIAWAPALLYVIGILLDAVDGAVARQTQVTELGRRLDAAVDAFGVLCGALAAIALGGIPAWYVLAGLSWYGYSSAVWLWRRRGKPVFDLPPSRLRGLVGATHMGIVAVALTPLAPQPPLTVLAAAALVVLLALFVRDWAAVTGLW